MKFEIETTRLSNGRYIAQIKWHKFDGGKVGTPGCVKYGFDAKEAYTKLEEILVMKGHEIV